MNEFRIQDVFLPIVALCDIALGFFVLYKNEYKSAVNRAFFLMTTMGCMWALLVAGFMGTSSYATAYVFINAIAPVTIGIAATIYHLALAFEHEGSRRYTPVFWVAYSLVFVSGLLCFVPGFYVKDIVFKPWGKENVLGFGYYADYAVYAVLILLAVIKLIKTFLQSSGTKRNQMKYVLISLVPPLTLGTFFGWFLVLVGNYRYIWVGPASTFIFFLIIFYTIIQHHLMDIELAKRKVFFYGIYIAIIAGVFIVLGGYVKNWFWGFAATYVLCTIVAMKGLGLVSGFKMMALGKPYEYLREMDRMIYASDPVYTTKEIIFRLVNDINNSMRLNNISFFLYKKSMKKFYPMGQIGGRHLGNELLAMVDLDDDSQLVKMLAAQKSPVLKSDLSAMPAGSRVLDVLRDMREVEAEVAIPLFFFNELNGILFLGEKANGILFDVREDIARLQKIVKTAERNLSHAVYLETRSIFSRGTSHDMKHYIDRVLDTSRQLSAAQTIEEKRQIEDNLGKELRFVSDVAHQLFDLTVIFSKIASNSYELKPTDLRQVVDEAVGSFKEAYREKGIELQVDLPSSLPDVIGNANDLNRVFQNLLGNALKFTHQGYVLISADRENGNIRVDVRDTGEGMPEWRKERVWEPFMYGEKSKLDRMRAGEGTGLGLPIVRDIIEAHKGKVWVESEENSGTVFFFTLKTDNDGSHGRELPIITEA